MTLAMWNRDPATCIREASADTTSFEKQCLASTGPSPSTVTPAGSMEMKRSQVRDEIITSEENYIKELRTLIVVYLRPLEKWVAEGMGGLALTADNISEVFSNVEDILAFSEELLGHVVAERQRQSWGCATFQRARDMFSTYSVYVKNYPTAMKRLEMCEEFPQFKAFIRACEFQEACHGLDVRACLIQPVQRVPRYRLLLIELLKYTHGNDPEWESLNASLQKVSSTVSKLNEEISVRELELQHDVQDAPSRPVKEGHLLKVCNGGLRRYKFTLYRDTLVYDTEKARAKFSMDHRKFKAHRRIPLHECLILDYDDSSDAFVVARPSGKSFVAMAVSAEEKQEWLDAFNECFAAMYEGSRPGDGAASPKSDTSSRRVSEDEWDQRLPAFHEQYAEAVPERCSSGAVQEALDAALSSFAKTRPPSTSIPTASLAQTLSGTMLTRFSSASGRYSLDWSRASTSTVGSGAMSIGSSSHADWFSFGTRSDSRVKVWLPFDGRTEMHEVGLQGLPPGSKFGVFKVRQAEGEISSGRAEQATERRSVSGSGWFSTTFPTFKNPISRRDSAGDVARNNDSRNRTLSPKPRLDMMPAFMRIGGERALVDEDDELGTAAGAQLGVVENTASAALLNGERRKEASATTEISGGDNVVSMEEDMDYDVDADSNDNAHIDRADNSNSPTQLRDRLADGTRERRPSWMLAAGTGNVRRMLAMFEQETFGGTTCSYAQDGRDEVQSSGWGSLLASSPTEARAEAELRPDLNPDSNLDDTTRVEEGKESRKRAVTCGASAEHMNEMVLPYRSSGGIGWPDNLLPRFPPTHPVVPAAFPGAASGRSNDGRNRGAPASGGLGDSSESNEEDVYEAKASQQFGTKFSSRSWARMRRSKPPHAGRSQGKREMSSSLGLFSSLQIGLRARIARSRSTKAGTGFMRPASSTL